MQLALYRAERPEVFEDIIGQKHIVKILENQIRTGTVSQAYLFAGTHGTGKTSTARILAKAVNCTGEADLPPCGKCESCESIREGRFPDCIELDAASNNGVDDLRAIIEMVKYPPAVGKYKVYIIDEVHMLSTAAENAFLKTLEEPPEHAIFILATTDPQKVRATIRSRCMQLNFRRVTEDELVEGMQRICTKRGINATPDALATIASRADGSVRDALSILEQCIAAGDSELTRAAVLDYTGAAGEDFFIALTGAVIAGDAGKALVYIDEISRRGKDSRQIMKDWLKHYRDLMIVKYVGKAERIVRASNENISRLRDQASLLDAEHIERAIRLISEYINLGRYSERPRILLETAAVKLASPYTGEAVPMQRVPIKPVKAAGPVTAQSAPVNKAAPISVDAEPEPGPVLQMEEPGDPAEMWDRIVREVAAREPSFMSLVGRHSRGVDYDSGGLIVIVSPGKLKIAEEKAREISRIVKSLYGSEVYVTLRGGDIDAGSRREDAATEAETSKIIEDDIDQNEIAEDIESLFGIKPTIEA